MRSNRRGEVITFYSFKGGVGRTMAVANIATLLAQQGKKVLALDFDFEAPGLHRYLLRKHERGEARFTPEEPRQGMIDLFHELRERLARRWPSGEGVDDPAAEAPAREIIREIFGTNAYVYRVEVDDPNDEGEHANFDFIPAARFDASYPGRVRGFDWADFYDKYAEVLPLFADELACRYDVVLIDSRTGLTDIGSICTMLLPDKLVLAFSPNEQSLQGTLEAGWQSIGERKRRPHSKPLPVFPLLSRVDEAEQKDKRRWIALARVEFEKMLGKAYGIEPYELRKYFNRVLIPHRGYYAYGERIAAEEEPTSVTGSMAEAYLRLLEALSCEDALEAARKASEDKQELVEHEALRLLDDEARLKQLIRQHPDDLAPRMLYAAQLWAKGRFVEAIEAWNDVVRTFGHDAEASEPALREQVGMALFNKGVTLGSLNRSEDEIAAYDELLRRFQDASEPALRELVAKALFNKGGTFGSLDRSEDAIAAYDELLRRFQDASEPALQERVARALVTKGVTFGSLDRSEDAIAAYDEVLRRFQDASEPALREPVAYALNGIGFTTLCKAKQTWQSGDEPAARTLLEQAAATIDAALQRLPENPMALGNAGYIAYLQGREDDARALLEQAIRLGGDPIRKAEIRDAGIHPLPQDEAFKALLGAL